MKKFFLIALSTFTISAMAVPTHKCPRVLEVSLQSFDLNYQENIANEESQDVRAAALKTRESFEKLARLRVKYTLKFAGGKKCYYEGHNQNGQYYRAKIEDALSGDAPYTLTNKNGSMAAQIKITSIERSGLSVDAPEAGLFHFKKNCGTSPCQTDYIPVGTASLRSLR